MLVSLLTATVINQINLLNQQARQQTGVLEAILRGVKLLWKLHYQINELLVPRCSLNIQVLILETQN